jgi:hypothetical protein
MTRNTMLLMGHHVAAVHVPGSWPSMVPYSASLRNHVINAAAIVFTWQALVDDVVQGQDSHLHLDGLQDRRGAGLACWSYVSGCLRQLRSPRTSIWPFLL